MSLFVTTPDGQNTTGFKKTTTFTFTTDLGGGDDILYFGDGNFTKISDDTPIEYTYDDHGLYEPQIIVCGESTAEPTNIISITVKPHISDSIIIDDYPETEYGGKLSENFNVSICSNCPPPLKIKLDVVSDSITPFKSQLPRDYKLDVTPNKYFKTDFEISDDNIITLYEKDLTECDICGPQLKYEATLD